MSPADGLVSTIIPVFNRPGLIREAVGSVIAQTYRPIEILIVDDGSTDGTAEVCADLARSHPEVTTLRVPNGGPGLAREYGRSRVGGEFVQYLDSDDTLDPTKFERQVTALRQQSDVGVAYCRTREYYMEDPGRWWSTEDSDTPLETLFPRILSGRPWRTPSPLFRRTVIDAVGPWGELRQEEDWEYDVRVAALGTKLVWCPELLADLRHHRGQRAGGDSLRDPARMRWRCEAHRLIYGHALRFGVPLEDPHMAHFARALFLLARQCGYVGLTSEAHAMFGLARRASTAARAKGWDFRLYEALASLFGWSLTGRLACWSDYLRPSPAMKRPG